MVTHQLRDAFFVATHEARRAADAIELHPADEGKADEAEFIMLKDGLVAFEGNATELRTSTGPAHQDLPGIEDCTYAAHRSLAWAELKIGLASVFAIVMATWLIFLLSGESGFWWQRYVIKTIFPNVAGLKPGAPVRVAGVEVGSVADVTFVGDRVEVLMEVGKDHASRITTTSVASLGSVSLLGEAAVDITAASNGTPVPEHGYVKSGPSAGSLTDVATQASSGIGQLTGLITDLRAGKGTAGKLMTDDVLYQDMTALVGAMEQVASNINRGRGSLGRLATDPTLVRSLEASMANLEMVTAKIRSGEVPGTVAERRRDGQVADEHHHEYGTITARLNRGEGTAGKLMTDQERTTG